MPGFRKPQMDLVQDTKLLHCTPSGMQKRRDQARFSASLTASEVGYHLKSGVVNGDFGGAFSALRRSLLRHGFVGFRRNAGSGSASDRVWSERPGSAPTGCWASDGARLRRHSFFGRDCLTCYSRAGTRNAAVPAAKAALKSGSRLARG